MIRRLLERLGLRRRKTYSELIREDEPFLYWPSGNLDEITIYPRAVSDDEVRTIIDNSDR